jgi:hypothetical protein
MPNPMAMMRKMEGSGMLVNLLRVLGVLLIVVAALIMVVGGTVPSNCFSTSPPTNCGLNYANGAYEAALIGKVLAVLGVAMIIFASGLRMQYGLKPTPETKPEEYAYLVGERRFNGLLIIVMLLVLILLMLWVSSYVGLPALT